MSPESAPPPATGHAGKYLTFYLGRESYGINILKTREIIGMQDVTRVPETESSLRGVINLRGQVIAVIDLRIKFGLEAVVNTEESCIVIVECGEMLTGLVVDRVDEVVDLPEAAIEPPPAFGRNGAERFILAMGKFRDRLLILLDSDRILLTTRGQRV